ncbi:MAG: quinolinate synthase NadA [Candidatus Omnitrophica bacterium]|nr:quinolinate synthase NadA [Candidatus Omnitrophota bacterium]
MVRPLLAASDPELASLPAEVLRARALALKRSRNAYIIAHNYQRGELQDLADATGDSLALAQAAIRADAPVVVFCGVDFMAETASILNPEKTILLPELNAGCPMAGMLTADQLRAKMAEHPDAAVVAYVNSSAEVKALSTICCTSANAVRVVRSLPHRRVLFVPDRNLGAYVQSQVPEKEIVLWEGFCPTHQRFKEEDIVRAEQQHPDAEFIAHPECRPEVLTHARHITSTSGMLDVVARSPASRFIIGTEDGMLYKLRQAHPTKEFILPTPRLVCPTMKMTKLASLVRSLERMEYEITVTGEIAARAKEALDRMLALTRESPMVAIAGY